MKDLDRSIALLLQENARLSFSDIAEQVGASVPTVSDRVRRMEEAGTIRGYHAHVDAPGVGLDVGAFVFVDVDSSMNYDSFRRNCRARREILECHAITGTSSHLLKVRVANTAALEQLLAAVQQWKGVTRTFTNIVLSTHKETTILSIPSSTTPGA